MTQAEPIPDVQYGISNWQDYINNWREKDAEWIQERIILRFATLTDRDSKLSAAKPGTYAWVNDIGGGEEMLTWKAKDNTWKNFRPLAQSFKQTETAGVVTLTHIQAGGKGLVFTGASGTGTISSSLPFSVLGTLGVGFDLGTNQPTTGVTIKTGTKTAKLTTDAANLISDTPLTLPGLTLNGVLAASGQTLNVGMINATGGSVTNLSVSGTLTGNKYTGTEFTITGGVSSKGNFFTAPTGGAAGTSGLVMGNGLAYGDSTGMLIRQRLASDGSVGEVWFRAQDRVLQAGGDANGSRFFDIYPQLRIRSGNDYAVQWLNDAGTVKGYMGIVVVSNASTNLPAGDYPNGTIWIATT